ncbi:MAG: iron ABC transporter permease [Myxococcota bacterium]
MSRHAAEGGPRAGWTWGILLLGTGTAFVLSLMSGAGSLDDAELRDTFFELRTYRFLNSFLAGAALATGGVLVQGLFRNPLASPSLLGTSAGASLGGSMVILLWDVLLVDFLPDVVPPELVLPIGCLLGALGALVLLLAVTGRNPDIVTLLLTGFILSSFFLSISGLITSLAQESWELGRAIVAFTLGGVEAKGPRHVALAVPMVFGGLAAAWAWGRHLDLLLSGEEEAASLGVDVGAVRRWTIVWTAVLTAAAVAIGGNVSFVGLVVPHVLRSRVGALHHRLVPAAFLGGGVFVAFADILIRHLPARGTIPLGVVTGLIGAPLFLKLLSDRTRTGRLA